MQWYLLSGSCEMFMNNFTTASGSVITAVETTSAGMPSNDAMYAEHRNTTDVSYVDGFIVDDLKFDTDTPEGCFGY